MRLAQEKMLVGIAAFWLLLANFPGSAQTNWKYHLLAYGWLAGLDGTVGLARQETPVEADFGDLAKYLDFAFGGYFEARNPKVSLIGDIFYVNLGADAQIRNSPVTAEADFREWIFEGAAGYRLSEVFEVLLAGRLYNMNVGVQAEGNSVPNRSKTWADIYLGARYRRDFAEKWFVSLRGDAGIGGSDFAWFGDAALGYRFSDLVSLSLGYRILGLDYESGEGADYFKWDVITNGFGVGLGFSF